MGSVFRERTEPVAVWLCFDFLSRHRTGGSSVIGYHLPESVPVFVRDLFCRGAHQLVIAQPGANARRWERIVWRFHNTRDDVLQEHVCYGDLRLHERLKMLPLLRQVRERGCNARQKALRKFKRFFWSSKPEDALRGSQKVVGVDHRSLPCEAKA